MLLFSLCIKPGGRAYLRGGSESTALSSQMAVVPDHSALQQAVGRQLAIRASRAVAHHTSFLFLPQHSNENVLPVQLVQQPP